MSTNTFPMTSSNPFNQSHSQHVNFEKEESYKNRYSEFTSSIAQLGRRSVREYRSEFILPNDVTVAVNRQECYMPMQDSLDVYVSLATAGDWEKVDMSSKPRHATLSIQQYLDQDAWARYILRCDASVEDTLIGLLKEEWPEDESQQEQQPDGGWVDNFGLKHRLQSPRNNLGPQPPVNVSTVSSSSDGSMEDLRLDSKIAPRQKHGKLPTNEDNSNHPGNTSYTLSSSNTTTPTDSSTATATRLDEFRSQPLNNQSKDSLDSGVSSMSRPKIQIVRDPTPETSLFVPNVPVVTATVSSTSNSAPGASASQMDDFMNRLIAKNQAKTPNEDSPRIGKIPILYAEEPEEKPEDVPPKDESTVPEALKYYLPQAKTSPPDDQEVHLVYSLTSRRSTPATEEEWNQRKAAAEDLIAQHLPTVVGPMEDISVHSTEVISSKICRQDFLKTIQPTTNEEQVLESSHFCPPPVTTFAETEYSLTRGDVGEKKDEKPFKDKIVIVRAPTEEPSTPFTTGIDVPDSVEKDEPEDLLTFKRATPSRAMPNRTKEEDEGKPRLSGVSIVREFELSEPFKAAVADSDMSEELEDSISFRRSAPSRSVPNRKKDDDEETKPRLPTVSIVREFEHHIPIEPVKKSNPAPFDVEDLLNQMILRNAHPSSVSEGPFLVTEGTMGGVSLPHLTEPAVSYVETFPVKDEKKPASIMIVRDFTDNANTSQRKDSETSVSSLPDSENGAIPEGKMPPFSPPIKKKAGQMSIDMYLPTPGEKKAPLTKASSEMLQTTKPKAEVCPKHPDVSSGEDSPCEIEERERRRRGLLQKSQKKPTTDVSDIVEQEINYDTVTAVQAARLSHKSNKPATRTPSQRPSVERNEVEMRVKPGERGRVQQGKGKQQRRSSTEDTSPDTRTFSIDANQHQPQTAVSAQQQLRVESMIESHTNMYRGVVRDRSQEIDRRHQQAIRESNSQHQRVVSGKPPQAKRGTLSKSARHRPTSSSATSDSDQFDERVEWQGKGAPHTTQHGTLPTAASVKVTSGPVQKPKPIPDQFDKHVETQKKRSSTEVPGTHVSTASNAVAGQVVMKPGKASPEKKRSTAATDRVTSLSTGSNKDVVVAPKKSGSRDISTTDDLLTANISSTFPDRSPSLSTPSETSTSGSSFTSETEDDVVVAELPKPVPTTVKEAQPAKKDMVSGIIETSGKGVKALGKMFSGLARKPSSEKKQERPKSTSDLQFTTMETMGLQPGKTKEPTTTERYEREIVSPRVGAAKPRSKSSSDMPQMHDEEPEDATVSVHHVSGAKAHLKKPIAAAGNLINKLTGSGHKEEPQPVVSGTTTTVSAKLEEPHSQEVAEAGSNSKSGLRGVFGSIKESFRGSVEVKGKSSKKETTLEDAEEAAVAAAAAMAKQTGENVESAQLHSAQHHQLISGKTSKVEDGGVVLRPVLSDTTNKQPSGKNGLLMTTTTTTTTTVVPGKSLKQATEENLKAADTNIDEETDDDSIEAARRFGTKSELASLSKKPAPTSEEKVAPQWQTIQETTEHTTVHLMEDEYEDLDQLNALARTHSQIIEPVAPQDGTATLGGVDRRPQSELNPQLSTETQIEGIRVRHTFQRYVPIVTVPAGILAQIEAKAAMQTATSMTALNAAPATAPQNGEGGNMQTDAAGGQSRPTSIVASLHPSTPVLVGGFYMPMTDRSANRASLPPGVNGGSTAGPGSVTSGGVGGGGRVKPRRLTSRQHVNTIFVPKRVHKVSGQDTGLITPQLTSGLQSAALKGTEEYKLGSVELRRKPVSARANGGSLMRVTRTTRTTKYLQAQPLDLNQAAIDFAIHFPHRMREEAATQRDQRLSMMPGTSVDGGDLSHDPRLSRMSVGYRMDLQLQWAEERRRKKRLLESGVYVDDLGDEAEGHRGVSVTSMRRMEVDPFNRLRVPARNADEWTGGPQRRMEFQMREERLLHKKYVRPVEGMTPVGPEIVVSPTLNSRRTASARGRSSSIGRLSQRFFRSSSTLHDPEDRASSLRRSASFSDRFGGTLQALSRDKRSRSLPLPQFERTSMLREAGSEYLDQAFVEPVINPKVCFETCV